MQMSRRSRSQIAQYAIAGVWVALAIARTVGPGWQSRMDVIFFSVLGVAAALCLVPLSGLKALKVGSIEVTLQQPEVEAAISGLQLTQFQNEELRATLESAKEILPSVRGSRVIWIDDHPERIVALRRVFRALGINVVCAVSTQNAKALLAVDADYDLLVSDVQRVGDTHETTGGTDIHEGTNFIVWLRSQCDDPVVRQLPVAFYASYDWERLVEFTEPARRTLPEPTISNAVPDFVDKVIHQLAKARSTPLRAGGAKEPTDPS